MQIGLKAAKLGQRFVNSKITYLKDCYEAVLTQYNSEKLQTLYLGPFNTALDTFSS